jgi:hypothetical protein
MNLLDFIRRFPGENECLQYFATIRENVETVCQKCGNNKHISIERRDQLQCKQCGNRINIKSGTIMENTKLPIKYWFITMFMLTSSDQVFSVSELQQKLGCREREQVEEMLNNLKAIMNKIEGKYTFDSLLYACSKNHNLN